MAKESGNLCKKRQLIPKNKFHEIFLKNSFFEDKKSITYIKNKI